MAPSSRDLLSSLQAARHLGITPELLAAYSRSTFCKRKPDARYLASHSISARVRYARADLDAFDAYLREPWSDDPQDRPAINAAVLAHLRAESQNQCTRCGSGSGVQTAHIESWSSTRSHHHHNLLRLCVTCHTGHDDTQVVPTAELHELKNALIARTRATLDRRIEPSIPRLRTHSCHSQKMTIAAMTMADMKVWAQRS